MKKGKVIAGMAGLYFMIAIGIYCMKIGSAPVNGNVSEGTTETAVEPEITMDYEVPNIISRYSLPKLERMEKDDQDKYVNNQQTIKKIGQLGLDTEDFLYPELSISNIETAISPAESICGGYGTKTDFNGTTSQELQQAIDENPNAVINMVSNQIRMTETVVLRNNTIINGNGAKFIAEGVTCGFMAQGVSGICINNIIVEGKIDYAMYFLDCDDINLSQNTIEGCQQKAVCVVGSSNGLLIRNNKMSANQSGALYLAGDVHKGLIEGNTIVNSGGNSDWMAGIVLTNAMSANGEDIGSVHDERRQFPNIDGREQLDCPHDMIFRNNKVMDNASVGIYSDGAYMCYMINNTVCQNDKVGISLNHGTIGFYLSGNMIAHNGRGMNQSDSSEAKLPGVSLDNAAYNILENNNITNNYGGGIKMVQTAIRNLVMGNIIRDNNPGKNDALSFYGIELGAGLNGIESVEVDYAPDYENIICKNIISGKHYSGIFIDEGCYINDVFDNVIMDSEVYGIEAVSQKFNSIMNNTTNCGVHNEFQ